MSGDANLPDVVPIAALFDDQLGPNLSADPRHALQAAQVILGVDVMSGRQFVLYGRERLGESRTPSPVRMLRIAVDQETDELEKLLALVQTIKGKHDYQLSDESNNWRS